jgi:hypothetical protein
MPAYDEELERGLEDKSLVLGGCVLGYEDPKWQCTNCDSEFYAWERIKNPNFHR